ncbi:MAG: carbohydrate-binding family 9-like protein [Odoribacter splanchnicus]
MYTNAEIIFRTHFPSWYPIDTAQPNFHVPQFFTDIEFNRCSNGEGNCSKGKFFLGKSVCLPSTEEWGR